jgi:hypothetical protein
MSARRDPALRVGDVVTVHCPSELRWHGEAVKVLSSRWNGRNHRYMVEPLGTVMLSRTRQATAAEFSESELEP